MRLEKRNNNRTQQEAPPSSRTPKKESTASGLAAFESIPHGTGLRQSSEGVGERLQTVESSGSRSEIQIPRPLQLTPAGFKPEELSAIVGVDVQDWDKTPEHKNTTQETQQTIPDGDQDGDSFDLRSGVATQREGYQQPERALNSPKN